MSVTGIGGSSANLVALQKQLNEQQRSQTQSDSDADSANAGSREAKILSLGSSRESVSAATPPVSLDGTGQMVDQYL